MRALITSYDYVKSVVQTHHLTHFSYVCSWRKEDLPLKKVYSKMTFQKQTHIKKNSRKNNRLENNELNWVDDVTCNFFQLGFTSGPMYLLSIGLVWQSCSFPSRLISVSYNRLSTQSQAKLIIITFPQESTFPNISCIPLHREVNIVHSLWS